jgi:ankyrin repeat protein
MAYKKYTYYLILLLFFFISNHTLKGSESNLHQACYNNNIEAVTRLLNTPDIDINRKKFNRACWGLGTGYVTPLYIACKQQNKEIVQLLLNDKRINDDPSALIIATIHNNIELVQLLLDSKKINPNNGACGDGNHTQTPLGIAIGNNYIEITKLLLDHPEIDPNKISIDYHGYKGTPLSLAVQHNHTIIIQLLFNHPKIHPNKYYLEKLDDFLEKKLFFINISINNAKLIFDHPATNRNQTSIIRHAKNISAEKYLKIIKLLLSYPDFNPNKFLDKACAYNHMEVIKYLFADPRINPLGPLLKYNNIDIHLTKLLLNHENFQPALEKYPHKQEICHKIFLDTCKSNMDIDTMSQIFNVLKININYIEKDFDIAQKVLPFDSSDLIHKEAIYHHLLRITPYVPDYQLYQELHKKLDHNFDICNKVLAYYKFLTLDRDIAQCFNIELSNNGKDFWYDWSDSESQGA